MPPVSIAVLFVFLLIPTLSFASNQKISTNSPFKWSIMIQNNGTFKHYEGNKQVNKILGKNAIIHKALNLECDLDFSSDTIGKKDFSLGLGISESITLNCTLNNHYLTIGATLCTYYPKETQHNSRDSKEFRYEDQNFGPTFSHVHVEISCQS